MRGNILTPPLDITVRRGSDSQALRHIALPKTSGNAQLFKRWGVLAFDEIGNGDAEQGGKTSQQLGARQSAGRLPC